MIVPKIMFNEKVNMVSRTMNYMRYSLYLY